jgi:hypothetical protein
MKLQPGKFDDLLVDMLIHIQTEVQIIRNFVITDHVERTGRNLDTVTREYEDMYNNARTTIISQIKSRYVDGFDPDDLLSRIK